MVKELFSQTFASLFLSFAVTLLQAKAATANWSLMAQAFRLNDVLQKQTVGILLCILSFSVTLLLANAAAVESMPLFMNQISNEIIAIVVSVTAVLLFGEWVTNITMPILSITTGRERYKEECGGCWTKNVCSGQYNGITRLQRRFLCIQMNHRTKKTCPCWFQMSYPS